MLITEQAKSLAERTSAAYSFDRYENWEETAQALLGWGLSEEGAAWVLESKFMRWAADKDGADYGKVPASAIINALNEPHPTLISKREDLRQVIRRGMEESN